jgi:hypothetical protein
LAFAAAAWRRGRRRSPAFVMWAVALLQFGIATAALAAGMAAGWPPWLYRVYYLFGAVLNVGWLGLGTVWLFTSGAKARAATIAVAFFSLCAAVAVLMAPLEPTAADALARAVPRGSLVLPSGARVWSRLFSIGGAVVVLGGLGFSILRRRERAAGLSLLVLGVVLVSVAGEFVRFGSVVPFTVGLVAGVAIMYLGFLRATPVRDSVER